MARLRSEHVEMTRLLELARGRRARAELRAHLGAFAELLERHVRWEERELFPYAEDHADEATLASIGGELEKRLVLAAAGGRRRRRGGRSAHRAIRLGRAARSARRPRPRTFAGSMPRARFVICSNSSSNGGAAPFMKRSGFTRATTNALR